MQCVSFAARLTMSRSTFSTVHKEIRCTVTDIFLLDIFLIDIFSFVGPMLVKKKKKKRHFSPTLDFIVIYLLLHWRTLQLNFFLIFTKQLFILYNLRTIWIKFDPLPRHRKSKADIIITNPPLGFQFSEWLVGGSERFIRATCSSVRYQKPAEGIADEFSFPCGHWGQKPSQTWWKDWRETL